jgi:hypothetical protein
MICFEDKKIRQEKTVLENGKCYNEISPELGLKKRRSPVEGGG